MTGIGARLRRRRPPARNAAVTTGVALLVALALSTVGWGAFLTLQRASPDELTAARALAVMNRLKLVDSTVHLQGRTLHGQCLSASFRPARGREAVPGELLTLDDGEVLFDNGNGPYSLLPTARPTTELNAEWLLAGCSSALRRIIGTRLGLRLPVQVVPVLRGYEELLRIAVPVGSHSTAYFFRPGSGAPRRMEYAGGGLSGWSDLEGVEPTHAEAAAMVARYDRIQSRVIAVH